MHPILEDLIGLLRLERIEENIFRGDSRDIGSPQVFGGQVVGQALSAAQNTVEGRIAHSLHGYFLRRGDVNSPIIYEVDRSRDGGSFSSRRVVAIQHGRPILNLAASFQVPEEGLSHQAEMPDVLGPDGLKDLTEVAKDMLEFIPSKMRRFLTDKRPFEFRHVEPVDFEVPKKSPPRKHVWIRAVDALPDNPVLHQNLLTYVSDYELLGVATLPHGLSFTRGSVIMASLDHALWFHSEVKMDEWLLYAMDSPVSSGARGLARGQIFSQDGRLIASTAQEGLMRVVDPDQWKPRSKPGSQN
ncbi:MAG: acyl-CoA thioesterase II [Gammaproteobacteria bacterium]|nr:acyl-CoA thioesterase II [Gammaproteobacteria bacterium]